MRLIKYMGSDDVRIIRAGDKFGGQLAEGIASDLVFDLSNSWVIDVEEAGLSEVAITALVREPGFMEVNANEIIPPNANQRKFRAHSGMDLSDEVSEEDFVPSAPVTVRPDGESVVFESNADEDESDGSDQADPPLPSASDLQKKAKK